MIVAQFWDKTSSGPLSVQVSDTLSISDAVAIEFDRVFAQKQLPEKIPEVKIPAEPIAASKLLLHCKLVSTGGEAKRMIKQGGASIDGKKLTTRRPKSRPKTTWSSASEKENSQE